MALRVQTDEPGSRLILFSPSPDPRRTVVTVGVIALLVVGIPLIAYRLVRLADAGFSRAAVLDFALGLLIVGGVVGVFATSAHRVRIVDRLAVDLSAGRIEIAESRLLGRGDVPDVVRIGDLAGMTVGAALTYRDRAQGAKARPAPWAASSRVAITVVLRFREALHRPQRSLAFAVEGLDRKDEGADLALRLGAAAGFGHQRLVRSDPRGVEMEFRALGAPGFAPLAEPTTRASYRGNVVADEAKALAAREEQPPFDPETLDADHRIETWEPGQLVRFRKPMAFGAIGCAPGLLLLPTGPLAFVFSKGPMAGRLLATGMFGFIGLLFGGLAWLVVRSSAPRTVTLDWTERRMRERRLLSESSHDFSEIRAIELKGLKTTGKAGTYCYCALIAQLVAPESHAKDPRSIKILETRSHLDDTDTPYRMVLPLATDLAKALGVPRVVTDFGWARASYQSQ